MNYATPFDNIESEPNELCMRAKRALSLTSPQGTRDAEMSQDIDYVLSQKPNNAKDCAGVGLAWSLKGYTGPNSDANRCWAEALKAFGQSLQRDRNCADTYIYRAQLRVWQEKPREESTD